MHTFICQFRICIRMVEHAEAEFHPQYIGHAAVDGFHGHAAFFHQLAQRLNELFGLCEVGAYIQARFYGLSYGILIICRHMMLAEKIFHRFAVGHYVAGEAIYLPQQLGQEVVAAGDGHAVPVVVAAHHAHRVRFRYHAAERVQEDLVHFPRRHMRVRAGIAIAAAFGHAVHGKVF